MMKTKSQSEVTSMKYPKASRKIAILAAAGISVAFVTGAVALTADENMVQQQKEHVVPGKQLKAKRPNYEFCEVGVIVGASPENAVVNFYNPTGVDHCSPEQFAQIVKDKEKITKDMGALNLFLNPSRHWTWDEFSVFELGDQRQFGPVNFVWMGVVPLQTMEKAVGAGHYNPGQIHRNNEIRLQGHAGLFARYARRQGPGHAIVDQLH